MFFEENLVQPSSRTGLPSSSLLSTSDHPPHSSAWEEEEEEEEDWFHRLASLTQCERQCPELLPYPTEQIQLLTAMIADREEEVLAKARQEAEEELSGAALRSLLPFKASDLMRLELQRIRFLLTEFVRCRIQKVEAMCMSLYYEGLVERQRQENEDGELASASSSPLQPVALPQRDRLSAGEVIVADRIAIALEKAALHAGLHLFPEPLQRLIPQPPLAEGNEILPEPNLDAYVFGLAVKDLGLVQLAEGAEQVIQQGDIFLVPYRTFRPHVLQGTVKLL